MALASPRRPLLILNRSQSNAGVSIFDAAFSFVGAHRQLLDTVTTFGSDMSNIFDFSALVLSRTAGGLLGECSPTSPLSLITDFTRRIRGLQQFISARIIARRSMTPCSTKNPGHVRCTRRHQVCQRPCARAPSRPKATASEAPPQPIAISSRAGIVIFMLSRRWKVRSMVARPPHPSVHGSFQL